MKPLHEKELDQAREMVAASGHDPRRFDFALSFMEPDPDGGGMFTLRYEITVTHGASGKSEGYIGGIGLDWLAAFAADLGGGGFD
ncbi:MAG: hypothetical protein FJX31_06740 [Alphaproteobacteria bacterium]|nr:hypothetical protein [Alphaproteobacteria bacterium]